MAVFSVGLNGASSYTRINKATASTGNPGINTMGGFTLCGGYNGTFTGNLFVNEVIMYAAVHDDWVQRRILAYAARKWRFAV